MRIGGRRCLLCDCEGTMPLDSAGVARALGAAEPALHDQLCRRQLDTVRAAAGEPVLIACTQEAPILGEAAPDARFVNIRERAGWFLRPLIAVLPEGKTLIFTSYQEGFFFI